MEENETTKLEEGTEKEKAKENKSLLKWIIIAFVVLVLGGGGFLVWRGMSSLDKSGAAAPKENAEEEEKIGKMLSLDTFIVNLAGGGENRYLKVTMSLELDGEKVEEEIKERTPQIRDSILTLLSCKSFKQVEGANGKNILRSEIVLRVNGLLPLGKVRGVYFTEFVVQ